MTSKASKTAAATTTTATTPPAAGARTSKAQAFEVAQGHSFHGRTGRIEAGATVKADDLKSKNDPTGEREFKRQQDKGAIVKSSGKTADDLKTGETRAGGGVLEQGGGTGAGPSGAQIADAATGNDPGAAAVVDAALTGTDKDLEQANGVDSDAAKPE